MHACDSFFLNVSQASYIEQLQMRDYSTIVRRKLVFVVTCVIVLARIG